MATVQTISQTFENYQPSITYINGERQPGSTVSREKTYTVDRSLEPESRPKPSPLYANLTPRGFQDRYTIDYGMEYSTTRDLYIYPNHYLVHDARLCAYSTAGTNGAFLEPDWITPLRNQVVDLKVNLGQDLAEYRQTVNLYSETVHTTKSAWTHYKKKHSRRKRGTLNPCHIAAADIIYGFGVAPLIGTLFDSYIALRTQLEFPTHVGIYQAAGRTNRLTGSDATYDYTGVWEKLARAQVTLTFNRGTGGNFAMGNPAYIGWELVPYSFLIDYLIPVGNWLSALDALKDVASVYGTVSYKWKVNSSTALRPQLFNLPVISNRATTFRYEGFQRDVVTEIPLPPFPRWKPSPSWHKLRHALALLYQSVKC